MLKVIIYVYTQQPVYIANDQSTARKHLLYVAIGEKSTELMNHQSISWRDERNDREHIRRNDQAVNKKSIYKDGE